MSDTWKPTAYLRVERDISGVCVIRQKWINYKMDEQWRPIPYFNNGIIIDKKPKSFLKKLYEAFN